MNKLLVIDNYDSFTYNLVQMFRYYDLDIHVFRSDMITLEQIEALNPDYVTISPGPKDPFHAGISVPLIKAFYNKLPILGVCLGMQCINEAFGGQTVRAPVPIHGKVSMIHHNNFGIFKGIQSPFAAARYHSLMATFRQTELVVTSRSPEGVVMGMSHPRYPLHGVQFHPESFLTEHGFLLVENFLKLGPLGASHFEMRNADAAQKPAACYG
ncbi:MAG: aminodeoxychorismate/anthranilate synthase component II [Desulfobacterales bacterium]|uniref:Aminodeoxychorismate/anthranilate synthase component II n=1 Tax=Candidatus Desulfatibia profunda TaxID=2841695 RepID=A0A8J6NW27_9BACT|nr:aminodeoxychorismate/anthranilate synthase component II [Candidatus Desulfatibia profunda]MBL7178784.1 aminodeoxychorismate/anthranilate synthase component II [Desulfobacterales bacterium]